MEFYHIANADPMTEEVQPATAFNKPTKGDPPVGICQLSGGLRARKLPVNVVDQFCRKWPVVVNSEKKMELLINCTWNRGVHINFAMKTHHRDNWANRVRDFRQHILANSADSVNQIHIIGTQRGPWTHIKGVEEFLEIRSSEYRRHKTSPNAPIATVWSSSETEFMAYLSRDCEECEYVQQSQDTRHAPPLWSGGYYNAYQDESVQENRAMNISQLSAYCRVAAFSNRATDRDDIDGFRPFDLFMNFGDKNVSSEDAMNGKARKHTRSFVKALRMLGLQVHAEAILVDPNQHIIARTAAALKSLSRVRRLPTPIMAPPIVDAQWDIWWSQEDSHIAASVEVQLDTLSRMDVSQVDRTYAEMCGAQAAVDKIVSDSKKSLLDATAPIGCSQTQERKPIDWRYVMPSDKDANLNGMLNVFPSYGLTLWEGASLRAQPKVKKNGTKKYVDRDDSPGAVNFVSVKDLRRPPIQELAQKGHTIVLVMLGKVAKSGDGNTADAQNTGDVIQVCVLVLGAQFNCWENEMDAYPSCMRTFGHFDRHGGTDFSETKICGKHHMSRYSSAVAFRVGQIAFDQELPIVHERHPCNHFVAQCAASVGHKFRGTFADTLDIESHNKEYCGVACCQKSHDFSRMRPITARHMKDMVATNLQQQNQVRFSDPYKDVCFHHVCSCVIYI